MYKMNLTKKLTEKGKQKIRNNVCGFIMYKIKKQKVLKVGTPPQWQRYRYQKESRLSWRGDSFWGFEKRVLKWVKAKDTWDKKRGNIIKGEYIVEEIAKKWVPKMKMWPYEDQLIRGSCAGVKDSQVAVTRECAKIHVLNFYSVIRKLEWIRDCGIRYKIIVNVENQKRRVVIQRLIRNTVKIAKFLFWHSKVKRLIIGYKKVINDNMSEIGGIKNDYSFNMIRNMAFLTEDKVSTLIRNSLKWRIYCGHCVKDCNYLSEKKGYQYSKGKRKRRVRVSGKKRLPHEEKKGENAKGQLWGISLYTND
jgi:hypothetical protein